MNHLGVVKPEIEDTWDFEGAIRLLQEAAAAGLKQLGSTSGSSNSNTVTSSATLIPSTPSNYATTTTTSGDQTIFTSNSEQSQSELTELLNIPTLLLPEGVGDPESGAAGPPSAVKAIWNLVSGSNESDKDENLGENGASRQLALGGPESVHLRGRKLNQLILETVCDWARSSIIEDVELIRQMFFLLYRQYGALDELRQGLTRTYAIGNRSKEDVSRLLRSLGRIRCLLGVQVGANEEVLLKNCLWDIMNNNVFFQHPDLIRVLAVHETVMQLMVHTLSKASLDSPSLAAATAAATVTAVNSTTSDLQHQRAVSPNAEGNHRRGQGSTGGSILPADQMQRYMAIKSANLPSAVAAPRTREFRCPPHVQIRNLLYMPGPGGPSGLLEEVGSSTEAEALSALELVDGADALVIDGSSKNPCAEDIKASQFTKLRT
nr:hypothetical transcript [Hymenolepis microstoma]